MDRSKPFHPPNILGVEKKEAYVLYDLLQLLALFYHRAILKVLLLGCGRSSVTLKVLGDLSRTMVLLVSLLVLLVVILVLLVIL